jgi:hypothetical protein
MGKEVNSFSLRRKQWGLVLVFRRADRWIPNDGAVKGQYHKQATLASDQLTVSHTIQYSAQLKPIIGLNFV